MTKTNHEILDAILRERVPDDLNLFPRIAAQLQKEKQPMQPRMKLALAFVLIVAVFAIFFSVPGVASAMRRMIGFIPGFGMVDQGAAIGVLAQPVSQTRDGITVSVESAMLTADRTVITYSQENLPQSAISHDENIVGCSGNATLRLPNGTELNTISGEGGFEKSRMVYPPIPADVDHVSFILPCVLEALPGKAPENWELILTFAVAPPNLTVMPVLEAPTATPGPIETAKPAQGEQSSLYGISLAIDKFIPIDDGYYLIGHTDWTDKRISETGSLLRAFDAKGQEVPMESNLSIDDSAVTSSLQPNQWVYRLYGKTFNGPLTLRSIDMSVSFKDPVQFALDLRPYNFTFTDDQLGKRLKIDPIALNLPNIRANVVSATYTKMGDMTGFEVNIEADPTLGGVGFQIMSGLDSSGINMAGGGGGGGPRNEKTGLLSSTFLANGKLSFPLGLVANGARINGKWETTWNPPAGDPNATPSVLPLACISLDEWKQAAANPAPWPSGLMGKILLSGKETVPGQLPSSLGLVIGDGALSPDGTQQIFSDRDDQLNMITIASQQTTTLPVAGKNFTPSWSPNGKQIAFTRETDKGMNIYMMDSNGQNVRALTDTPQNPTLIGWRDDQHVIVSMPKGEGTLIETIDTNTIDEEPLLMLNQQRDPFASISPDGKWIAFSDKMPGRVALGIYIARLDGSDRRLLMQLDYWITSHPIWSPDGHWLAFTVTSNDSMVSISTPALVNVENCQVIPLTNLTGQIEQWINP